MVDYFCAFTASFLVNKGELLTFWKVSLCVSTYYTIEKKIHAYFSTNQKSHSLRCWCWYVNSSHTRWVLSNESQIEIKLCMKLYELSDSCGLLHHQSSFPLNNILVPSLVSQKRKRGILSEYFMCLSFVCDTCNLKTYMQQLCIFVYTLTLVLYLWLKLVCF